MIEIYAGSTLIQTIRKVMSANIRETLEGEFTLSFTVLAKFALALKTKQLAKLNNQYFEIVQITKSLQGSLPVCSVTCEHVSYILNDEIFNIDAFDFTGDPAAGLNQLLSGTPFSAGMVDFTESCTMKINQEVTRRAALMQYIAILGGEIEYNGYLINVRQHRGSSEYQPVMGSKNVTDVSVSHDSRENASSYYISFFKLLNLAVGDNVHILFKPLGIDVKTRGCPKSHS
ncbi:prophage endopeptidase tail family protein [Schinkia azotoformans]|uniref:prophage endopeptidase tail family protein n=1 Tax=Schinkia azotoformans TaxID=1454 RepID=UPI002DBCCD93|nr:prophage endopeptidase tail family protein [Schinkia azotoformans]MEC1722216.1 prophage endopeptidase tail family protein [Schinkia azotoformans]MED4412422.1 prophage endopeptidase tail family protein [Schinkia azotoformans]